MEFLRKVKANLKNKDQELVMVMDNHSAHKSKETLNYMESLNIKPLFMSPYSPELNSIESLWGVTKSRIKRDMYQLENYHAITHAQFQEIVLASLQCTPDQIAGILRSNH